MKYLLSIFLLLPVMSFAREAYYLVPSLHDVEFKDGCFRVTYWDPTREYINMVIEVSAIRAKKDRIYFNKGDIVSIVNK
jgi:hypothetical protein